MNYLNLVYLAQLGRFCPYHIVFDKDSFRFSKRLLALGTTIFRRSYSTKPVSLVIYKPDLDFIIDHYWFKKPALNLMGLSLIELSKNDKYEIELEYNRVGGTTPKGKGNLAFIADGCCGLPKTKYKTDFDEDKYLCSKCGSVNNYITSKVIVLAY